MLLVINAAIAQPASLNTYATIDKKAMLLPDSASKTTAGIASYITANFTTAKDRSRAIFIWVANHIEYNVANMFAINFYETEADKINKPLATGKGICENYTAVFNDVCHKCGIPCYVVEGYTKQKGFTDYIPHAWCAALIDTDWFIFDPTWGSGYVSNGQFTRKINNDYYKASPAAIIRSHMPFDYFWEFLNYPVTNQELYDGQTDENKLKPYFNFKDSIALYNKQTYTEQLTNSARRIEKNGLQRMECCYAKSQTCCCGAILDLETTGPTSQLLLLQARRTIKALLTQLIGTRLFYTPS